MASIKDVAKLAGVSTATVSRVLNNNPNVSNKNRALILNAINELNYRRDRVARSLRVNKSLIIGLIISDIENPFFTSVVRGVEDIAHENGYSVLLCNSDESIEKERLYLDVLLAEKVTGIIISPTSDLDNSDYRAVQELIPMVAMDRRMLDLKLDTVIVNNIQGAYEATKHLIKLGHQRIGFIGGSHHNTTSKEREEGYIRALVEAEIAIDPQLIKSTNFKMDGGYNASKELLSMKNPPTAIFMGNNLSTLGALNYIHEQEKKIPNDIAVIGFDDMPWAPSLDPPLTVVSQPAYQLGHTAAKVLIDRINNKDNEYQEVILECNLLVRVSCGSKQN